MDWPNEKQNRIRFRLMSEIFATEEISNEQKLKILDFGCGTSHFFEYLSEESKSSQLLYTGIDINAAAIEIARKKFPNNEYKTLDILNEKREIGEYDYIIINGLFTQKKGMSDDQMKSFLIDILDSLFPHFKKKLCFNAMSNQVDYKREEGFYLDLNWISNVIVSRFTRDFIVRHDYGLYENTIILKK